MRNETRKENEAMRVSINVIDYGQRQMCQVRFSEHPTDEWLRAFLSRCDANPTETETRCQSIVLFRDKFRRHFNELVQSAASCATELVELGMA